MKRTPPRDRPHVSVNFAITWDGRIATNGGSANFSSKADKHRLLEIRALADAVLVSARTAEADGMSMGLPAARLRAERVARGQAEFPLRVLISNSGRIDAALPVFQKRFSPIHVFSSEKMPKAARAKLAAVSTLHLSPGDKVELSVMLKILQQELGVRRLHCEGGGALFRSLAAEGCVDEIYLTVCPRIFGGSKGPTLTGRAGDFLPASIRASLAAFEVCGEECFLRYTVG